MIYKTDKCPYCGSTLIRQTSAYDKDGNTFFEYVCKSCDTTFSTESKYNAEQRKIERASRPAVKKVNTATEIFRNNIDKVVEVLGLEQDGVSSGSGFVISKNGYIITNAHVVAHLNDEKDKIEDLKENIIASLPTKNVKYELEFVTADVLKDIALLKIDCEDIAPVLFREDVPDIGEKVYAIGNSKGQGICLIDGIVSDNNRKLSKQGDMIMITAPVTNGNSGGPVFDECGRVIGMVACNQKDAVAMNYIIPSNTLLEFLDTAKTNEDIIL